MSELRVELRALRKDVRALQASVDRLEIDRDAARREIGNLFTLMMLSEDLDDRVDALEGAVGMVPGEAWARPGEVVAELLCDVPSWQGSELTPFGPPVEPGVPVYGHWYGEDGKPGTWRFKLPTASTTGQPYAVTCASGARVRHLLVKL